MNIYLVRHGQKNIQPGDPELTPLGFAQAQQTAVFLQDKKLEAIFASPAKRTQQTAKVISDLLNLPVQTSPLLKERMDWLDHKQSKEEFLHEWTKATADRDFIPQFGQSSKATGKRLEQFLYQLADKKLNNILLVSHGGAIMDFLRNLFPDQNFQALKKRYPAGWDFQCHHCSLTQVCLHPAPTIKLLNYTSHLTQTTE
jgi:broad specificity phosphatase PhoE